MDNPDIEDQPNNPSGNDSDTEMTNAPAADQQMQDHTDEHARSNGANDKAQASTAKKTPDPVVSAPGSWQIPPGALAANNAAPNTTTKSSTPPVVVPTAMSKAAERIEKVEQRIREDQYDVDAWTILINETQSTGDLQAIRGVYERVLKVFPTSVRGYFSNCCMYGECIRYWVEKLCRTPVFCGVGISYMTRNCSPFVSS